MPRRPKDQRALLSLHRVRILWRGADLPQRGEGWHRRHTRGGVGGTRGVVWAAHAGWHRWHTRGGVGSRRFVRLASGIGGVTCSLAGSTLEESVSAALLGFLTRAAGLIDGVSELTGKRGEPKTEDRSCCAGLVAAPVQNPAPSCTGRCGGADELREGASDGGGLGNPGMLEVSCAAVLPGNSRGRAPLRVD